MPVTSYQGSGEAGLLRPISKDQYTSVVGVEMVDAVLAATCSVYGCCQPSKVTMDTGNVYRWGLYKYDTKEIILDKPQLGTLLHELAHHVVRQAYPVRIGGAHGTTFYEVLQELHDMWRREVA